MSFSNWYIPQANVPACVLYPKNPSLEGTSLVLIHFLRQRTGGSWEWHKAWALSKMGIPAAEFGDKLCCVHYKQRVGYSELLWFKMEPSEDFLPQTSECLGFLDVVFPNVLPFFLGRQTFCSGKSDWSMARSLWNNDPARKIIEFFSPKNVGIHPLCHQLPFGDDQFFPSSMVQGVLGDGFREIDRYLEVLSAASLAWKPSVVCTGKILSKPKKTSTKFTSCGIYRIYPYMCDMYTYMCIYIYVLIYKAHNI